MIFQCISGRFPFLAKTQYLMWEKVKKLEYDFPEEFDSDARDLVERILVCCFFPSDFVLCLCDQVIDPEQRLGAGGEDTDLSPKALRGHKYFQDIVWETLWTIPVPALQPGLYTREPEVDEDGQVYDAGAAWDALVSNESIPWVNGNGHGNGVPLEFLGMRGVHPDMIAPHQIARSESTINP